MPIINSVISAGKTPTGTKQITTNGTHDVADYANADVQVPTTAPAYYIEKLKTNSDELVSTTNFINLSGVKYLSNFCLAGQYYGIIFPADTVIDISDVIEIRTSSLQQTFNQTRNIKKIDMRNVNSIWGTYSCQDFVSYSDVKEVDLRSLIRFGSNSCANRMFKASKLENIRLDSLKLVANTSSGEIFSTCKYLTSINLPSLEKIETSGFGSAFSYCDLLSSVDMSKVLSVGSSGFYSGFSACISLVSFNFYSLCSLENRALRSLFYHCSSLTTVFFPALKPTSFGSSTNQFESMLSGVTGCTVHFPSNIQSVIGSWSHVVNGFSGTNTTVLFDLPATVTLTGADTIEYERNPKDDTQTSLAWRKVGYDADGFVLDWTSFYTSTTSDPQVGDTIYSDSACTTALTTISSIA